MAEKEKIGGLEVPAFTLGVIGIIFCGIYGIFLSVVGLVFALIQQKRHKTRMGKMAITLNIIALVLSIIVIAIYAYLSPYIAQISE